MTDQNPAAPAGTTTAPTPAPQPETDWKAEVDKWKSLSRQNEERAKANAEAAKRLTEIEEASKTEAQKLADRAAAAEARAEKAELDALKTAVAAAKGLPASQAKRLSGKTQAELEADADELLAEMGKKPPAGGQQGSRPVESLKSGALPASGTATSDMNDWMRRNRGKTTGS